VDTPTFKYYLNSIFAIVFAAGMERLFRLFDPLILNWDQQKASLLTPRFYVPLALITFTLVVGLLAAVANDRLLTATSGGFPRGVRLLTIGSTFFIVSMFYFSTDLSLVPLWFLAYGLLSGVNAAWNYLALRSLRSKEAREHVWINGLLGIALIALVFFDTGFLRMLRGILVMLAVIVFIKWYQRSHERFPEPAPDSTAA
jgi:hypothetical protein